LLASSWQLDGLQLLKRLFENNLVLQSELIDMKCLIIFYFLFACGSNCDT